MKTYAIVRAGFNAHGLPAIAGLLIAVVLSGCAGHKVQTLSDVLDEDALAAEISVTGPLDIRTTNNVTRRTFGFAQATVLYARSVQVDPINRPVSNFLSLSSVALKSAGGMIRRAAIGTARFPSLATQPIPELSDADGMDLRQWEIDLDKISGQKRQMGKIELLVDGEEYFSRLMEAFKDATETIDIRTYIFDNDDFAVEVADYLKSRSQETTPRRRLSTEKSLSSAA